MKFSACALVLLTAVAAAPGTTQAQMPLKMPLGLDAGAVVVHPDNPLSAEKIALGKQFFWDKRWSGTKTVACVTCHLPHHGWSDPDRFSLESTGKRGTRHSPTLVNRTFSGLQQWTGARASLEIQAFNSRDRHPEAKWFAEIPYYRTEFRKIFGRDLDAPGVAQAIAAYVRTILSGNAPYDRFRAGDAAAISPAARRGLALFEGKAGCVVCHRGFNFTDEGYHNLGVSMELPKPDLGRHVVTKVEADKGAFKTPTLRDVAQRGPFMHDGSLRTLEEVIAFYNRGGAPNPWISPLLRPLGLTADEQTDLLEFMQALTGHVSPEVSSAPALPE
jgi:cytochrome c peroxidase